MVRDVEADDRLREARAELADFQAMLASRPWLAVLSKVVSWREAAERRVLHDDLSDAELREALGAAAAHRSVEAAPRRMLTKLTAMVDELESRQIDA